MSGLTDTAFRRLARRFGASLLVSEMVASERFAKGDAEEALKGAEDTAGEPYVVQLAGRDPDWMGEAARRAEAEGASIIDINMGCPAKRVVGGYAGSALMRDLDLATSLIAAVMSATSVPVTVKMRLGWDHQSLNAPDLARRAQDLGVCMIAVHGRTRCQFYEGIADWNAVRAVVDQVTVPVFVNGDITSTDEARTALAQSGAHGVMIGRASIGRPWLLGQIRADLNGVDYAAPGVATRKAAVLEQFRESIAIYGPRKGLLHFRKHLAAYLEHEGIERAIIGDACRLDAADAVERAVEAAFDRHVMRMAA